MLSSRMVIRLLVSTTMLIGGILLAACAGSAAEQTPPPTAAPTFTPAPQTLLIWHAYTGTERTALEQIQADFTALHPEINLELAFVEPSSILADFEAAVNGGAGPDLLLGPAGWIPLLADKGLIRAFGEDLVRPWIESLPETGLLYYADEPYGAAFQADYATLYYNAALVQSPPATLAGLVAEGTDAGLLIVPSFFTTAAIGGFQVTDPTRPTLENYLIQLETLAETPGVTFSDDYAPFVRGEVGYLLASSADYPALKDVLGDRLQAAPLLRVPSGGGKTPLHLQVALQNLNSTATSRQAAEAFILYLTSADTQRHWFEVTGRSPVNPSALADPAFRQAWASAITIGLPAPFDAGLEAALDDAVRAVTLNGTDPAAAADAVLTTLNAASP